MKLKKKIEPCRWWLYCRGSEERVNASGVGEADVVQPLASDFHICLTTSLAVLAVYTVTLHTSVPGGDSGL